MPRLCKWWLEHPPRVAWWPRPLTFWPWNWFWNWNRGPWHGQLSCQFLCFCDFSLCSYGQMYQTDYDTIYYLDLWKPLRSPRKSLMRVFVGVGHKPPPGPKPLTKAPPVRSPFGRKPPKTKTLLPPSQTSNKVTL